MSHDIVSDSDCCCLCKSKPHSVTVTRYALYFKQITIGDGALSRASCDGALSRATRTGAQNVPVSRAGPKKNIISPEA